MNNVKKKRRGDTITILLLLVVLLVLCIYVLFNFGYADAKPTTAQNICQDTVIKMGTVELLITDQNDETLEPMRNFDIDTGFSYSSDIYKVRVRNVGTLPLKFELFPEKKEDASETLSKKVTFWGMKGNIDYAQDLTVGQGYLSKKPRLAKCSYLEPGDYRDIDIQATIRKDISLEYLDCEYDIYVRALQAEPR